MQLAGPRIIGRIAPLRRIAVPHHQPDGVDVAFEYTPQSYTAAAHQVQNTCRGAGPRGFGADAKTAHKRGDNGAQRASAGQRGDVVSRKCAGAVQFLRIGPVGLDDRCQPCHQSFDGLFGVVGRVHAHDQAETSCAGVA